MSLPISMIPGPVAVPDFVSKALAHDHGFARPEEEFLPLYQTTSKLLAKCMGTNNEVAIMTGEGMLALWAGLKSTLKAGDRVLAIATGIFGEGIGQMAAGLGCNVRTLSYPFNTTICDLQNIEDAIASFKPHMITAVHCETPSGTLNPLDGIAALKKKYSVPLLYVDAVSSLGGAPVCMDDWQIDLLLGASQKCFSAPPNLCFLGISPAAWDVITSINYQGYDALLPWKGVNLSGSFPYTPYWSGVAALHQAVQSLLDEGLENAFARHEAVAQICRKGLQNLDITLWPDPKAIASPTVTTAHIPQNFTWDTWQKTLRKQGLTIGCGLGPLAGKVFRLGHMGSQADPLLMQKTIEIIKKALHKD